MLTVLLATRNRGQILRDVLESYCCLQQPTSGWKLVVVDNGSTDETAEVIASFESRLPVHSMWEPKLGKNHALNTGLGLVEGDLLVFTDDDAFPYVDWLVQLRKAADAQPAYSMFGGAIVPRWEVPPPRWIQWLDLRPVYALTEPSLKEGPVAPLLIYGPNMAIRSSVFQSGVRFNPFVGPRGSSYPQGGETELILRLAGQGHRGWHVHRAVAEHFIREEQLRKTWVMKRAIRYGRGEYRLGYSEEVRSRKRLMGMPRYLLREIYEEGVLMTKACVSFKQEDFFRSRWRLNFLRGQAIEARFLARQRRVQAESAASDG
jgi:glycosyltransferase involved in cell wall biosynthesis